MSFRFTGADAVIRHSLAQCSREWWDRYRWLAWLLIAVVWLHVLVLAFAMAWNVLDALDYVGYSGGT